MPCEHMGILLSRYVDGEASEDDRRLVEGHVGECGDCRQELEVFRRNENLLSQALSEEVAGEAFVADVLAKAGLAPSRPSPVRKALRRAVRGVGEWFGTPARVAAALLFAFSGYLSYAAVTLHRHNEQLISDVSAAIQRLQQANEKNAALLAMIQKSQQAPPQEVVKLPPPPPPDVAGVPPPPLHIPEFHDGHVVPQERAPEFRKGQPGEWFHSVTAKPEEDGVYLAWETGPIDSRLTFNVVRKSPADPEFGKPLNPAPLPSLQLCYRDGTAAPLCSYSYMVLGIHEDGSTDRSRPIEVRTLGDLYLQNNGGMKLGNGVGSNIEVRKYVQGQWVSQTFNVAVGEPIGKVDPKTGVDFSTGCVLVKVEDAKRSYNLPHQRSKLDENGNPVADPVTKRPVMVFEEIPIVEHANRVTIQDSGKKEFLLWRGEGRLGKVGSLE